MHGFFKATKIALKIYFKIYIEYIFKYHYYFQDNLRTTYSVAVFKVILLLLIIRAVRNKKSVLKIASWAEICHLESHIYL